LQCLDARNVYFHEIKLAKQTSWNDFLENADSQQIYQAYRYCKQRKIEKIPIICYNNQKATTFSEKSEAFLQALLPNTAELAADASSATYIPYSNSVSHLKSAENQWNWPKLTENELEKAVFSFSTKKASGPDRIGFLIVQKAYSNIPKLFYQLYSILIKVGFHPEC